MKKISAFLLTALIFLLTAACAEGISSPAMEWYTDAANHWQLNENSEVINLSAHKVTNGWLCSVCNSGISDYDDGTVDVTNYDAHGNSVRFTSYDESGKVVHLSFHVLTYNEDGIVLSDQYYVNNQLAYSSLYYVNENGEPIPIFDANWLEDGSYSVAQYDAYGNCVRASSYASDGMMESETISEYASVEDEDGLSYYEFKRLARYATGESYYSETNERGDTLRVLNIGADGTVLDDYEYQIEYSNDMWRWRGTYAQGQLIHEEKYTEDGYLGEEIAHLKDGSYTVTLYDYNEEPATATTYAADGAVITQTVYERVYNEEDYLLVERIVTDGRIVKESRYLYVTDEEGWSGFMGHVDTVYHEDGTYTVTECDYTVFTTRTTLHAADGSVIEEIITENEVYSFDEE